MSTRLFLFILFAALIAPKAIAQEATSKIEGYGTLIMTGPQVSKLEAYAVLQTINPAVPQTFTFPR